MGKKEKGQSLQGHRVHVKGILFFSLYNWNLLKCLSRESHDELFLFKRTSQNVDLSRSCAKKPVVGTSWEAITVVWARGESGWRAVERSEKYLVSKIA